MKNKKEQEKELKQIKKFERENCFICKKCRKRNSCLIVPVRNDFCTGFEEGTPWEDPQIQYYKDKENESNKISDI